MPRDYGKITHRFWTGETGKAMRSMPMDVRTVATYLLSCGSSNMIGLYYLPLTLMVHEIGSDMTLEGASKALRRLAELEFAHYDELAEVVFVPHMAAIQIGASLSTNDRQRLGVISLLNEHRKTKFYADFVWTYCEAYHLEELAKNLPDNKPLLGPFEAPSKPGEQESREQRAGEQEQISVPQTGQPCECSEAVSVREVFAHYRKLHPRAFRNPQPDGKEWRLIRARLREGSTVEELCQAIDGYHASPYHQGKNERGTKYLDLELFVRDGSHVAKGLEFFAQPPAPADQPTGFRWPKAQAS